MPFLAWMCSVNFEPPKTVRVGGEIGGYRAEKIERGHVVFITPSGERLTVASATSQAGDSLSFASRVAAMAAVFSASAACAASIAGFAESMLGCSLLLVASSRAVA